MIREFTGTLDASRGRYAIVISRFNRAVTRSLLDGATSALVDHGAAEDRIEVYHVPGAFEITAAADACARRGSYQAIICLGAIVRGETPHFDFIAQEVSRGVNEIGLRYAIGVGFGVLTTDTMEQALSRSGDGHGNKGYEAAVTALEMEGVLAEIARRG